MKVKIYTKSTMHLTELEKGDAGDRFSADEHARMSRLDFQAKITSKSDLLEEALLRSSHKFKALSLLLGRVNLKNYTDILSLGSGTSALEYYIYDALGCKRSITSSDFDPFFVELSNKFFHEFETKQFDYCTQKLTQVFNKKFDVAVFFGSMYVMDDNEMFDLSTDLKQYGVKEIIDFHAGFIDKIACIKALIKKIIPINKHGKIELGYKGKFHGYLRSRGELIKLYQAAGWNVSLEDNCDGYKYIAVLN